MKMKNNAPQIRAFLVENEVTQAQIAELLGVSGSMINRWIGGDSRSKRIYDYFLRLGCPREYLEDRPEARRGA